MACTIHLWGELGDRYQPVTRLEVSTFREARLALCSVFEGFKHWVLEHEEYAYHCVAKGVNWERELTLEADDFPLVDMELHIVPVLEGSGQVGQLIGGLLLIGIGIATGGIGLVLAGGLMLFGAIAGNKTKAPDAASNFLNTGNLLTTEGNPIPICCGIVLMKSPQVLSYKVTSARDS
jgi:predicted phage tail protein